MLIFFSYSNICCHFYLSAYFHLNLVFIRLFTGMAAFIFFNREVVILNGIIFVQDFSLDGQFIISADRDFKIRVLPFPFESMNE